MVSAELRADDAWSWAPASGEASAKAWIPATEQPDLALILTFPTARRCYTAELMLTDREGHVLPSTRLTVTADGEQFILSASPSHAVGVYEAPPPVFHALKRVRTLGLTTPDAEYVFSAAGSAAAINSAWDACEDDVRAEKASDTSTQDSADPTARTDSIAGDPTYGASAERPVAGTPARRHVFSIIVLIFAMGNALLTLHLIAKTFSLPVSPAASGQWRRSAALVGAVGWIVLPLITYAAYGLLAAALAVAAYLTAGLVLAAVIKPTVVQYAVKHLVDRVRDLRLRAMGVTPGSRLLVDGYRRLARQQAMAPTDKTTDVEILKLFERVGSGFKTVAYGRGESLKGPQLNHIVWMFLQTYEALSSDAFDAYLQQELGKYRKEGLPAAYRNELRF